MTSHALPATAPAATEILRHVTEMYTSVALGHPDDLHFPVGRKAAEFVGYPSAELDALPESAIESFAGVAYPFLVDAIRPGDTVLDIGSGSGTDLLIAAMRAGRTGRAFGLDVTPAMLRKALANVQMAVAHNAFLLKGDAGIEIPLPDASVQVVTSNGVVNLIHDKRRAFAEAYRVMAPGGSLQLADIIVHRRMSGSARCDGELWAACIAGADEEDLYLATIQSAGFEDVRVERRLDYFAAAPREDARQTARHYKAEAIVVSARKGRA